MGPEIGLLPAHPVGAKEHGAEKPAVNGGLIHHEGVLLVVPAVASDCHDCVLPSRQLPALANEPSADCQSHTGIFGALRCKVTSGRCQRLVSCCQVVRYGSVHDNNKTVKLRDCLQACHQPSAGFSTRRCLSFCICSWAGSEGEQCTRNVGFRAPPSQEGRLARYSHLKSP